MFFSTTAPWPMNIPFHAMGQQLRPPSLGGNHAGPASLSQPPRRPTLPISYLASPSTIARAFSLPAGCLILYYITAWPEFTRWLPHLILYYSMALSARPSLYYISFVFYYLFPLLLARSRRRGSVSVPYGPLSSSRRLEPASTSPLPPPCVSRVQPSVV